MNNILDKSEKYAKIIDELLVMFDMYKEDLSIVKDALDCIAETRNNNPNYPITVSLAIFLREEGLID